MGFSGLTFLLLGAISLIPVVWMRRFWILKIFLFLAGLGFVNTAVNMWGWEFGFITLLNAIIFGTGAWAFWRHRGDHVVALIISVILGFATVAALILLLNPFGVGSVFSDAWSIFWTGIVTGFQTFWTTITGA